MRLMQNPALCNHVHLPVQSGSNGVLSRMQRLYSRDQYMRRIEWMKNAKRDIAITTDIIVGFPGETEADFNETLRLGGRGRIRFDVHLQVLQAAEYRRLFSMRITFRRKKRRGV